MPFARGRSVCRMKKNYQLRKLNTSTDLHHRILHATSSVQNHFFKFAQENNHKIWNIRSDTDNITRDGNTKRFKQHEVLKSMNVDPPEFLNILRSKDTSEVRKALKEFLTVLPCDLPEEVNALVDSILEEESKKSHVIDVQSIPKQFNKVALWKGDITQLKIDAIVNAANKDMLGCFVPNHACIDNVIQCKAGPRLRAELRQIMSRQGHPEPNGQAKITKAYMLPSQYILHTVGPIVPKGQEVSEEHRRDLANCYTSCLNLLRDRHLRSIAFCCISTGIFGFPQKEAAEVATDAVREWMLNPSNRASVDVVLFNVFTQKDEEIYKDILPTKFRDL